jgi:pyruvate/2-oxoglutarate/acetoin dehydrogenase E1 component
VLFFEHKRLYSLKGALDGVDELPLGRARVLREGDDATLVSAMKGVHDCLAAADLLAEQGVSAEVIDLQTVRPLDVETLVGSVTRTNRVAVVEEGPRNGGWGGEVLARITEEALGDLDDAWRIATDDTPIPYSLSAGGRIPTGPERIAAEVPARP